MYENAFLFTDMFKTELHCHSRHVSTCAHASHEEIIEKYINAGYTTIVSTEHINPWTFPRELEEGTWRKRLDYFMDAYERFVKAAEGKLNILLGAEIRFFRENNSDYLVYGLTREFLSDLGDPRQMRGGIDALSRAVHEYGGMIYQAHPFRPTMMVTSPSLLDGIEVANMSPWHESHNSIAKAWAKETGLQGISGTDFHDPDHVPLGGIMTDTPITTNEELLSVLRSGKYDLIEKTF